MRPPLRGRDPHDRDHVPIVVRLLFCVLVAGPDKALLGRKGLSVLLDPKLAVARRRGACLRWRDAPSLIPGFKTVSMRDVIMQPGSKTMGPPMMNAMICHIPEGERLWLRVNESTP
jgi:hypothetical protein